MQKPGKWRPLFSRRKSDPVAMKSRQIYHWVRETPIIVEDQTSFFLSVLVTYLGSKWTSVALGRVDWRRDFSTNSISRNVFNLPWKFIIFLFHDNCV